MLVLRYFCLRIFSLFKYSKNLYKNYVLYALWISNNWQPLFRGIKKFINFNKCTVLNNRFVGTWIDHAWIFARLLFFKFIHHPKKFGNLQKYVVFFPICHSLKNLPKKSWINLKETKKNYIFPWLKIFTEIKKVNFKVQQLHLFKTTSPHLIYLLLHN